MTRVLYISYDGMTDSLGRSQVIPYLCGLAEKGYKFQVLSCEKPATFRSYRDKVSEIFKESAIGWSPLRFSTNPPGLSKIFDVINLRRAARKLHKKHSFHLVHCRSYIASFAGYDLKNHFGVPFVFDMRGFWADERVEGNIWKLSNPFMRFIYRYFKNREKDFLSGAEGVVSLTHTGKKLIGQHFGERISEKTTVIPCCTDIGLFSPDRFSRGAKAMVRSRININENDFVLTYLGSIGTWYMTEEMLAFFKRLQITTPRTYFLFITADDPGIILRMAGQAGIDTSSIRIVKASREQVPEYLSISDLCIFFIKKVFSKKASSPTKQGEIMSMGLPFITNQGIGDTDQLVNETGAGIMTDDFNDEAYDKVIAQIPGLLSLDARHIRQSAVKYFNLEQGVDSYHQIYKSIAG